MITKKTKAMYNHIMASARLKLQRNNQYIIFGHDQAYNVNIQRCPLCLNEKVEIATYQWKICCSWGKKLYASGDKGTKLIPWRCQAVWYKRLFFQTILITNVFSLTHIASAVSISFTWTLFIELKVTLA